MMKEVPYAIVFSIVTVLCFGAEVDGQDRPVVPQDELLPLEDPPNLHDIPPDIEHNGGGIEANGHCEGECAGEACACGSCSSCMQKFKELQQEKLHMCYLKSHHGGAAQYTHQWNMYHAQQTPWHGGYYHTAWGRPLALVVPPTATFQTRWSWGVGQTTVVPLYHQFGRPYPGNYDAGGGMQFRGTPMWPSHTDQFGVYYVRGPW